MNTGQDKERSQRPRLVEDDRRMCLGNRFKMSWKPLSRDEGEARRPDDALAYLDGKGLPDGSDGGPIISFALQWHGRDIDPSIEGARRRSSQDTILATRRRSAVETRHDRARTESGTLRSNSMSESAVPVSWLRSLHTQIG